MRTMTWEEIDKDWEQVQRHCRDYVQQHEAEAIAKYCIGHDIKDVASRLSLSPRTVQRRLELIGVAAAVGGAQSTPLEARQRETVKLIEQYGPKKQDRDEFEPYVDHYRQQGYTDAAAERIAKAEWAGEAAADAGAIRETKNKKDEKVNRILFPKDNKDTFDLDLRMHMARVKSAAKFLDDAKVRNLRRKSTCEKVAEADELWRAQAELVLAHYQPS